MNEQLIEIMSRWLSTGHISDHQKALLKTQYLSDIGAVPSCTTCDDFWWDVKHHFSYQLKQLNLTPVAKSIRKYLILGAAFLMLPGDSTVYVNEGEESEDRKVLTDEKAEAILKEFPDYSSLIGINPAWQARQDLLAEGKADDGDDDSDEATDSTVAADSSKSKLAELQAKYDALEADYNTLKKDHTSLKGQFTRLKNSTTVQPADPAPGIEPTPDAKTDVTTTPLTGTPDG